MGGRTAQTIVMIKSLTDRWEYSNALALFAAPDWLTHVSAFIWVILRMRGLSLTPVFILYCTKYFSLWYLPVCLHFILLLLYVMYIAVNYLVVCLVKKNIFKLKWVELYAVFSWCCKPFQWLGNCTTTTKLFLRI